MVCVADQTISDGRFGRRIIILCREILVSGLREYLAELKVPVPVSVIAKWKTTVQLFALGFFIAGPAGEVVLPGTVMIGSVLLWIAAVLTLYTGCDYMSAGWAHFGESEDESVLFRFRARTDRLSEEEIVPPGEVSTVAELIGWLAARGEGYAAAFANAARSAPPSTNHATHDAPISPRARSPFSRR